VIQPTNTFVMILEKIIGAIIAHRNTQAPQRATLMIFLHIAAGIS